jgi:hypothetical protein
MADDNQNIPPKPSEASKVAPKKETVRISLPPKPTASPTIKLPAMPAGGPGAAKPAPTAAAPAAPSAKAPAAPRPPASSSSMKVAAPQPQKLSNAPRPAQRPVAVASQSSMLDKVLAIVAMIVSLLAVGSLYYLFYIITQNPPKG